MREYRTLFSICSECASEITWKVFEGTTGNKPKKCPICKSKDSLCTPTLSCIRHPRYYLENPQRHLYTLGFLVGARGLEQEEKLNRKIAYRDGYKAGRKWRIKNIGVKPCKVN